MAINIESNFWRMHQGVDQNDGIDQQEKEYPKSVDLALERKDPRQRLCDGPSPCFVRHWIGIQVSHSS
jgi:hypothetical protein